MVGSSHDSHILTNDESSARKGNEDLAHDDVANAAIVATEIDGQACSQEHERKTKEQTGVLEVLGVADVKTEDNRPEARADVVDLAHVSGVRDGKVVDHNDKVVVVQIPRIEAEVDDRGQAAGTKNGTLLEEFPADELDTCELCFPSSKDEEQEESDDNHGDEGGAVVSSSTVGFQAEWQQEQDESGHQQETANDVKLVNVVDN